MAWNDRFKQKHWKKLESRRLTDDEIHQINSADPSAIFPELEIRRSGKSLSLRQGKEEVLRAEISDQMGGNYAYFSKDGKGLGPAINARSKLDGQDWGKTAHRLAQDLGIRQADPVGQQSQPQPQPQPRPIQQPQRTPAVEREFKLPPPPDPANQRRGRDYLASRGIGPEVIAHAEQSGFLSYTPGAVLFVGRDEAGQPRAGTRRYVAPAPGKPKALDLPGSAKADNPGILPGNPKEVFVVEGGTDALATHQLARDAGKPAPTVIVSGGANVMGFLERRPDIQNLIKNADRVSVWGERESTPEKQQKTDAAHQKQVEKIKEIRGESPTQQHSAAPQGSPTPTQQQGQQAQPGQAQQPGAVALVYPPVGNKDLADILAKKPVAGKTMDKAIDVAQKVCEGAVDEMSGLVLGIMGL